MGRKFFFSLRRHGQQGRGAHQASFDIWPNPCAPSKPLPSELSALRFSWFVTLWFASRWGDDDDDDDRSQCI